PSTIHPFSLHDALPISRPGKSNFYRFPLMLHVPQQYNFYLFRQGQSSGLFFPYSAFFQISAACPLPRSGGHSRLGPRYHLRLYQILFYIDLLSFAGWQSLYFAPPEFWRVFLLVSLFLVYKRTKYRYIKEVLEE